jgi:hypothetical protein
MGDETSAPVFRPYTAPYAEKKTKTKRHCNQRRKSSGNFLQLQTMPSGRALLEAPAPMKKEGTTPHIEYNIARKYRTQKDQEGESRETTDNKNEITSVFASAV